MAIKAAPACTCPFSDDHFHRNVERIPRLNLYRRVLISVSRVIGRWDKIDKHHVREKVEVQLLVIQSPNYGRRNAAAGEPSCISRSAIQPLGETSKM